MQGIRKTLKKEPKQQKHYDDEDDYNDEMSDEKKNVGELLCLLLLFGMWTFCYVYEGFDKLNRK